MRRSFLLVLALVFAVSGVALAQGTQTGTLTGTVTSSDGQPLPGVTVSIKSDALLGTRTAVSDANGGYIFKALPPGTYTVNFALSGFGAFEKQVTLALGSTLPVDASLQVAGVQEQVTVTAEGTTPLDTTQVGANYKTDMIDRLATPRTVFGVAQLAPGLTTNATPNANQLQIAGSFAYDNVFLIDGVDVNDNLFGTANTVFIEDAVEETQVLTSGISAEYGRFGGGVVNTITKRGGNRFSGSLRVNFTNPSWRNETPIEVKKKIVRDNKLNKFWEATLGGPVLKDHLWFFLAGRKESSQTQSTLPESGLPFTQDRDQKRYEAKVTGAVNPNHTLTATYTGVNDTVYRLPFSFDIDPVHDAYTGKQPNTLLVLNYNGTLRSNLFVEAQFSRKTFEFQNNGGSSKNIIDSPYIAQSVLAAYNAPYFDATDPESRNNRQFAASVSYFLSTESVGKHDIKVGFENYQSSRTGGNSQSSTSYVFYTDYLTDAAGKPVFDANNYVIPVFTPGVSQLQNWQAVRGAEIKLTTNSVYLNDRVTFNRFLSLNLGARAEWATGKATAGIEPVNSSRIVPRLGASFDVRGDGRFKLDATYSQYAGKYSETQFANNTNVGNPNAIYYNYTGPEGQGRDFAPGIDPANYSEIIGGTFPTANVKYDKDIKSPVTTEWTGAFGVALPNNGYVKAIYTYRKINDFVQLYVNTKTGTTDVVSNGTDFGTFSNRLWANDTTGKRSYSALQFQAGYTPFRNWNANAHYTYMFKNDGDQEGEAPNQPGTPSIFSGYYPELFTPDRNYPSGHLSSYQKHRLRAWTTYDLRLGRAGDLSFGLLYSFDSGAAYSIRSTGQSLTPIQKAKGQDLYPDLPTSQTIFYQGRGTQYFEPQHLVNVSLHYGIPVWKTVQPWIKFEVRNLFDSTPLLKYNISTKPDPNSPKDANGIPTGYIKAATFGQGTATTDYPFPREFFVSLGIRF